MFRRSASWLARLGLCACVLFVTAGARAEERRPQATKQADATSPLVRQVMETYLYAYPLVLMDVTRDVMSRRVGIGAFDHLREFPDASFTDVVSPNADTLYSLGWLDLSTEPMVLSLPAMGNRYYLMPMLDGWTNVFASPGTRTTGNGKGDYAIVGPRWNGTLPKGLKTIQAPTSIVWILGRVQTNGKADYAAVRKLQDRFALTPLSAWGKTASSAKPAPATTTEASKPVSPAEQVAGMNAEVFFTRFQKLLADNPTLPADGPMVATMKALGIEAQRPFSIKQLDSQRVHAFDAGVKAAQQRLAAEAKSLQTVGTTKNGWNVTLGLGSYGVNYGKRALVALVGLGANLTEDAVYPMTRVDAEGKPLHGSNAYVLHFRRDELPPVRAFWSVTMYNDKQAFVANPIDRFAIGDRDKLKFNKDGSLDLYLQRARPDKGKESNWLPAPEGAFNLVMRLYHPKKQVVDGQWAPPPVRKVAAATEAHAK